jgi:hypothetical protein
MPIQIAQSAVPTGKDHWVWSVWLEGSAAELDGVDHVVYTLHSTFSEPVRRINDRKSGFRLDSSGWGEFSIHIAVHHRSGRVQQLKHWLQLGWNAQPPQEPARRPRIYLSYGLADAAAAAAIGSALQDKEGIRVMTSEEVADSPSEMPFDRLIHETLKSVTRAVFLVSPNASPWIKREAEIAESLGIPRVYITVSGDDIYPRPTEEEGPRVTALQVERLEPENAGDVAQAITRWSQEV